MSQPNVSLPVQSSAISDRGLNERRPLNEDSFLADNARGVFAVADGVGGAEAGEVASQTAVEVLDEAFRHHVDGADIEDLMELAIQRANSSIHQMAQDHVKFSMMATTIVALHLNGSTATIGHVGDSRLYRLTPAGQLIRETEDHSVVEEEVRAGRMTPEQAANHPSKNVISRALGAENDVEVDMKTLEVEDGTQFLLCSDGITRHVPDHEIRQLLLLNEDLGMVCDELKKRCYERGAEDNLTAVLVRVGQTIPTDRRMNELERTVTPEDLMYPPTEEMPTTMLKRESSNGQERLIPPSRVAFPAVEAAAPPGASEIHSEPKTPLNIAPPGKTNSGSSMGRALLLLLAVVAIGAAFYAGRKYKGPMPFAQPVAESTPQVAPTPNPADDATVKFEQARRDVDKDPAAWLAKLKPADPNQPQPSIDSLDPQTLYLYGRANLLTGNTEEAAKAFEAVLGKAPASPENVTLRNEATLALAALTLKADQKKSEALPHYDQMLQKPASTSSP